MYKVAPGNFNFSLRILLIFDDVCNTKRGNFAKTIDYEHCIDWLWENGSRN